jgi:hypothetical protein
MSHFLFFWLLFILDNLLKNASRFVGCLTLLEEKDELERVSEHCLVQIHKLKLMCLGLRTEDLFTLLLSRGHFHHLAEVATLKIAEELYLMPYELVHWHESRFLGSKMTADQLVADIGDPGNGLKVIPDAFVKVCLHTVCIVGALLCDEVHLFSQTNVLKTLTHQVKQCWTIVLLSIQESSQNF